MTPFRRRAATLTALAVLTIALPSQALAAPADDLWYFEAAGMSAIHERTTGKGIQIAVIDTAIWPDAPDLRGASLRVHEPSFCAEQTLGDPLPAAQRTPAAAHGTGMTSLIIGTGEGIDGVPGTIGVAPDADVWFYSSLVRPDGGGQNDTCHTPAGSTVPLQFGKAINQAVADGADIISISLSNDAPSDFPAIARALNAGAIVVTAASENGDRPYPAAYNGVVAVESAGPDLKIRPGARPYVAAVVAPGERVRQVNDDLQTSSAMNGSSNAAAFTAGALALVWSAYPQATGNQILQTLIRNTDVRDHEIYHHDYYGYGLANVRHMLEHDPTTYPDLNPLLEHDPHAVPSLAHVADPALAEKDAGWEDLGTTPGPTADATTPPAPPRPTPSAATVIATTAEREPGRTPSALVLSGLGATAASALVAVAVLRRVRAGRDSRGHHPPAAPSTGATGTDARDGASG